MVQAWKEVDPEVLDLVRQATDDPKSILLKPGADWDRGVRHEATLTPASTGLSPVDRELLRAYREEAAYLLRVRAFQALHNDASLVGVVVKDLRLSKRVQLPSNEQVAARSRVISEFAPDEVEGSCLVQTPGTCTKLAQAALRLEPRDQPRLMMSLSSIGAKDYQTAWGLLDGVLSGGASRPDASAALDQIGTMEGMKGNHATQLEYHLLSAEQLPDAYQSISNGLVAAVLGQNQPASAEFARRLDDLLPIGHQDLVARAELRLTRSRAVLSGAGARIKAELREWVGAASQQVLNGIR